MEFAKQPLTEATVDAILATWQGTKPLPPSDPEPLFVLPSTCASDDMIDRINKARSQGNAWYATYLQGLYVEAITRERITELTNRMQYERRLRQTGWLRYYKAQLTWYFGIERHYNSIADQVDRSHISDDVQMRRLDAYHFAANLEACETQKVVTQDSLDLQVRCD